MSKAQAYYNEIDPYAAQWLRNLISEGLIAPGVVDQRSIEDVKPSDLTGFTQCHFFAGLGGWSIALRQAGISDATPIWTGSCPCQPFSNAGQGAGFADERHLWPAFHWLIQQCKPSRVFGEQVAGNDGLTWLDLIQADLEASGYAVGAVVLPAAGVGAPHLRHRVYWVADTDSHGLPEVPQPGVHYQQHHAESRGAAGRLGNANHAGLEGYSGHGDIETGRPQPVRSTAQAGSVNGFWADARWIGPGTDGKVRPIESGVEPLVDGSPEIVGLLRAYGNAICVPLAEEFIRAYMSTTQQQQ